MRADGRQLKLTLRKGVQFHTGRELTAEDVALADCGFRGCRSDL
jgi:ABC-type transport system substrate-binding protein